MLDGNLMEMNLRRLVSVLESRMEPYCIGCMRNDFSPSCTEAVIGVDLVQHTVVIRRAVGIDFTISTSTPLYGACRGSMLKTSLIRHGVSSSLVDGLQLQ